MNTVLDLLKTLRACALEEGLVMAIEYHEEDSYLTRFANSAISLRISRRGRPLRQRSYTLSRSSSVNDLPPKINASSAYTTAWAYFCVQYLYKGVTGN